MTELIVRQRRWLHKYPRRYLLSTQVSTQVFRCKRRMVNTCRPHWAGEEEHDIIRRRHDQFLWSVHARQTQYIKYMIKCGCMVIPCSNRLALLGFNGTINRGAVNCLRPQLWLVQVAYSYQA